MMSFREYLEESVNKPIKYGKYILAPQESTDYREILDPWGNEFSLSTKARKAQAVRLGVGRYYNTVDISVENTVTGEKTIHDAFRYESMDGKPSDIRIKIVRFDPNNKLHIYHVNVIIDYLMGKKAA